MFFLFRNIMGGGGGGGGGVNRIRKALIYFRELRKLGSGYQLLERGWERVK